MGGDDYEWFPWHDASLMIQASGRCRSHQIVAHQGQRQVCWMDAMCASIGIQAISMISLGSFSSNRLGCSLTGAAPLTGERTFL